MRTPAQTTESNSDTDAAQSQAVELFNRGQDAHERSAFAEAVKFYEDALKIYSNFPEIEYQRGSALLSLGKTSEAEKAFRRALELRGDWTLAMSSLGALLVRENKFEEAEKILTQAIKLDEQNFPAFAALAAMRLRQKAAPDALKPLLLKFKNLTDGKANVPAAVWAARGSLERALGNKAEARKSLEYALKSDSKNVTALFERAELNLGEGDLAAARADADAALKISSPNDRFQAHLLLSRILAESGNAAESLKVLDALSEPEKSRPEAKNLRNAILANGASGTEGISALEKLLENDSSNVAILSRLCNLSRTVNPARALDYCRRASQLEPSNVSHAVGYGAALVQAKQFAAAVELFNKLLTFAPDNYTARANLATALYELKRYSESIKEFQRLLETRPDVAATYFFIATAYDSSGEYVNALAAYQKFLQIADPQQNQLEIDKVKLRLPAVERQIEKGAGKKNKPGKT